MSRKPIQSGSPRVSGGRFRQQADRSDECGEESSRHQRDNIVAFWLRRATDARDRPRYCETREALKGWLQILATARGPETTQGLMRIRHTAM